MFSAVEILIIAVLLTLIIGGSWRFTRLSRGVKAKPRENLVRLLLFVILVLLLIGFIVRAVMPLGGNRF